MPYVSSSGRKLYVDGPANTNSTKQVAYVVIAAAMLLSVLALVRLGIAASAAVHAVSNAAVVATASRNASLAGAG